MPQISSPTPDATTLAKGKVQLAGDLSGTAALPNVRRLTDANGNELVLTSATASAVNEITVTNAATAGTPNITATGGDTNINLGLYGKGTGVSKFSQRIQLNTTSSSSTGSFTQEGWGQINGTGTATMTMAVTFPTTFTTVTNVTIGWLGFRNTAGAATLIGDFDSAISGGNNIGAINITTSGFTATFNSTGTFGARYHGFSWSATGV